MRVDPNICLFIWKKNTVEFSKKNRFREEILKEISRKWMNHKKTIAPGGLGNSLSYI